MSKVSMCLRLVCICAHADASHGVVEHVDRGGARSIN